MRELRAAVESVVFAVGSTTALSGVGRFKKWKRQALRQCDDLTPTGKHRSLLQKKKKKKQQECKKPNSAVYVGHTTEEHGWIMAAMRVAGTCFVVL